jgi:6-phospho-beta-glucosidase
MKLALIGGGGVRAPLLVMAVLRRAEQLGLQELCLMDIDPRKLRLFGGLSQELVRRKGSSFTLTTTTDLRTALEGAGHVVTTLRVGNEQGRVLDERIALEHGVLGQETTGAGGFAMALRSIPAVLEVARLLEQVSPRAWIYNFTNPAGMVTQALHQAGFTRAVGICDSANGGQHAVAAWAGVSPEHVQAEVFGLNHLSWCRKARVNGKDVLPEALADDQFLSTAQRLFDPELVRMLGMYCNEYLYYYYSAEKALQALQAAAKTRGEEILGLNQQLLQYLEGIDIERQPDQALRAFFSYENRRSATYMSRSPEQESSSPADSPDFLNAEIPDHTGEGYAGVALAVIQALETGQPLYTALNIPNQGAIPGLEAGDVVEVSCRVDGEGIHPLPVGSVPPGPMGLILAVKQYERLAVQAIFQRSRRLAVEALMAHPLVLSYSRARPLVDAYLEAHAKYISEWEAG